MTMIQGQPVPFPVGARVRLRGAASGVELTAETGRLLRPDVWLGYYIVRLDRPARYRHADGHVEEIIEIRQPGAAMDLLPG
jgi:hypothetical protein